MNRICVSAVALLVLAGAAHAQSVDFKFRTRLSPSPNPGTVSAVNTVLDIAVQARVTGGYALSGFDFDIALPGEGDTGKGTFGQARIMSASLPNNYVSNTAPWGANAAVDQGGLAKHYAYLAGLDDKFNGVINGNFAGNPTPGIVGTFTNNPADNEIGLIAGSLRAARLFAVPGLDPDAISTPSTWSGQGTAGTGYYDRDVNTNAFNFPPVPGVSTAPIDADGSTYGTDFFGGGSYVDIYHFRYIVTSIQARDLVFTLRNAHAQVFNQYLFSAAGTWGPDSTAAAENAVTSSTLTIHVTPTPSTMALLGLGGLVAARRRRA